MQVFLIEDKRKFMTGLLTGNAFDRFLLSKGRIEAKGHLSIPGRPAEGFFDIADGYVPDVSGYLPYSVYRDTFFSFIKGDRTPVGMMLQLVLPREQVEQLISDAQCTIPSSDVESLSILIRFREGSLTITTGTSIGGFYPDRSLDRSLDAYVRGFLTDLNISFSEQI